MHTWVVLLRGINVGGHNRVPMAALREVYGDAGCDPVLTYIQSGNVVVGSPEDDAGSLGLLLRAGLTERTGVDAALMVRSAEEWRDAVAANPFADADEDHLHLALLDAAPGPEAVERVAAATTGPERVHVVDRQAYWCLPEGVTAARKVLTAFDRAAGPSTLRNWRTVLRISALVADAEARQAG